MWGASSLGIPSLGMSLESEISGETSFLKRKDTIKLYINKDYNNMNDDTKYIFDNCLFLSFSLYKNYAPNKFIMPNTKITVHLILNA